jgi:hypothetical protein
MIPLTSGVYCPGAPLFINLKTAAASVMWLHFRFISNGYNSTNATAGSTWFAFQDDVGNDIAGVYVSSTSNTLVARAIGDTTVTGATFNKIDATVYTFDVQLTVNSTNIIINLYSGGSLISSATAANSTGHKLMPKHVKFDHANVFRVTANVNAYLSYSEFIVTDNENTIGWRVAALKPNAAGNYTTGWIGNYTKVADFDPATGCGTDTALNRMSWAPSAYGGVSSPTSIRGLFLKANAQVSGTGPQKLNQFLRIASTDYDGTDQTVIPGYQTVQEFANNPNTTVPWTTTDFASMEFGIKSAA